MHTKVKVKSIFPASVNKEFQTISKEFLWQRVRILLFSKNQQIQSQSSEKAT
jgi:hypothetical protein